MEDSKKGFPLMIFSVGYAETETSRWKHGQTKCEPFMSKRECWQYQTT